MKKISLIILLLCVIAAKAQNKEVQPNTVSVMGRSLVERTNTLFKAKISLNMDQVYYSDPNCKSLEELKEKYFNELKINGIDVNQLKEKKIEFLTYGYQKEGTVFVFETPSEEKIQKLAEVRMNGVSVQYQHKSVIEPEHRVTLIKEALKNAKENAERVCKVAGKNLGDIVSISDGTNQFSTWGTYGSSYDEYYNIYVIYSIK